MVWSGLWFSRFERHNHLAGIQEFVARSDLQETARTIRPRAHPAGERSRPALQSTSTERPHGLACRSYRAAEPGCRGDRLLWIKNKCDVRACLAARTDRRPDYSGALRAAAGRTLSNHFSSEDRPHRRDDPPANRANMLEFIRTLCAKKSSALALDVQTLALPSCKRRSALPILRECLRAIRENSPSPSTRKRNQWRCAVARKL